MCRKLLLLVLLLQGLPFKALHSQTTKDHDYFFGNFTGGVLLPSDSYNNGIDGFVSVGLDFGIQAKSTFYNLALYGGAYTSDKTFPVVYRDSVVFSDDLSQVAAVLEIGRRVFSTEQHDLNQHKT